MVEFSGLWKIHLNLHVIKHDYIIHGSRSEFFTNSSQNKPKTLILKI